MILCAYLAVLILLIPLILVVIDPKHLLNKLPIIHHRVFKSCKLQGAAAQKTRSLWILIIIWPIMKLKERSAKALSQLYTSVMKR